MTLPPDRPVSVVTGATSGIGRFIALGLARAGHHVILVCRDRGRGEAAAAWIGQHAPESSTEVRLADLASLQATRRVGEEIAAAHSRVGLLVNNAGIFAARRRATAEGLEAVLAVNHLAPFVLSDALDAALRAAAPARIVNVGSSTSDRAGIDPDNLQLARRWGMVRAYSRSKLAMMMATFARAERLRGSGVVANVVHPGAVATSLVREGGAVGAGWRLMAPFLLSEEQGADTPLYVALAPEWAEITAAYVKRRAPVRPNRRALDPGLVQKVVAATHDLVARTFSAGG